MFHITYDVALALDCELAGLSPNPDAAILDSQLVKAPAVAERGYGVGEKIAGRKSTTSPSVLTVRLNPADVSGSAGAQLILDALRKRWS